MTEEEIITEIKDREILLRGLEQDGMILEFASEIYKSDVEVVTKGKKRRKKKFFVLKIKLK